MGAIVKTNHSTFFDYRLIYPERQSQGRMVTENTINKYIKRVTNP